MISTCQSGLGVDPNRAQAFAAHPNTKEACLFANELIGMSLAWCMVKKGCRT